MPHMISMRAPDTTRVVPNGSHYRDSRLGHIHMYKKMAAHVPLRLRSWSPEITLHDGHWPMYGHIHQLSSALTTHRFFMTTHSQFCLD